MNGGEEQAAGLKNWQPDEEQKQMKKRKRLPWAARTSVVSELACKGNPVF